MSYKVSNPSLNGASRQYRLSAMMITTLRRLNGASFGEPECLSVIPTLLALEKRGLVSLVKGAIWSAALTPAGADLFPESV